ncbi:MAG: universal stress protein [Desulfosarcina sp.]|nr:universal stress protein [Desulfobacterales bacterium]
MNDKNKVLVTVDGSNQAFDTARYAGRILAGCEARIVLYHVRLTVDEAILDMGINPAGRRRMAEIRAWDNEQRKAADALLEKSREVMEQAGVARERITLRASPRAIGIARDIIKESRNGYDAVMVGRRGHHRVKGLVLGSVANKLIERLRHVSLCVVGGNPPPEKVLIALDASEGAMRAVDHVVSTRCGHGSRQIYLVHVVRTRSAMPAPIFAQLPLDEVELLLAEASQAIQPVFQSATQRLEAAGFERDRIHTEVMTGVESRSTALIQFARQNEIGSMVMGRRGLSRVKDFIMGRVGHKIVNTVRNRAVLLVP